MSMIQSDEEKPDLDYYTFKKSADDNPFDITNEVAQDALSYSKSSHSGGSPTLLKFGKGSNNLEKSN